MTLAAAIAGHHDLIQGVTMKKLVLIVLAAAGIGLAVKAAKSR